MAVAAQKGLESKYPGLKGDNTGTHADIVPDKVTGLYTLCFTDTKKMGFKATLEKFKSYSTQVPVISRGLGKEQVLLGFPDKCAAVDALSDNFDSEEFPKMHIAPSSRG